MDACIILFASTLVGLLPTIDTAFLYDSKGTVGPKNPYGFIGETLNLTCNLTDRSISGNMSGSMYFTKHFEDGERVVPLKFVRILNTRSIHLEYPVRSGDDQGSYTCHLNTTEETELILGSQYVTVDYRPVAVKMVKCNVYNWEEMTCNWDLSQDYYNKDLVQVQLVWAIFDIDVGRDGQWDCPHQNKTSCTWKSKDGNNSFQAGKMYYMSVIVITKDKNGKKVAESQSDIFNVDTMLIVKPAPVVHLKVSSRNSTCISLSWEHGKKHRDLMYRLHVWQGDYVEEYNSIRKKSKTVCGLHPAKDFVFQVSCIPIPHKRSQPQGKYSDWTSIVTRTLEDAPSGIPLLEPGSFRYDHCPQSKECVITVYWKSVPDSESNGEITCYKVKQTDRKSGDILEKIVNGTKRSVRLGVQKDRDYLVELKARTRVGYSSRSASIMIQRMQYQMPFPDKFLVEALDNTLHISWDPPIVTHNSPQGRRTGYTLYYCNGTKFTLKCLDEIEWITLDSDDNSFKWKVAGDSLNNKMVGISSEMEIAHKVVSSGILWSLCIYKKNENPSKVENVKFSKTQPDNGLMVKWDRPDCSKYPVYVSKFIITYCRASIQQGCAGPLENFTVQNTRTSYIIKDLAAGVSYRITMRAVSRAGQGPESEPIIMEVVNSDLNTGEIVGVVFAGLFLFVLFVIFATYIYRKCCHLKKDFYMDVDIPVLPPLRDPLHDSQHHYPGRPLPQPPVSHTVTGPDDGYSSADTDPACEATRYEPVSTKSKTEKPVTSRNVSVSSETAPLLPMEDNIDGHDKCQPYQVTHLGKVLSASLQASKRYNRNFGVLAANASHVSREDMSVDSYLRVDNYTNSPRHCSSSSLGQPLLDVSSSHFNHRVPYFPYPNTQVGFVMMAPPLSDPPPSPAPPPVGHNIPLNDVSTQPSDNISSDVESAIVGQGGANTTVETGLYSKIGSDGCLTSPANQTYISCDHAQSPRATFTPNMTSTPHGGQSVGRPLSEYMKYLPSSYYHEPQPDQELGPTTEL